MFPHPASAGEPHDAFCNRRMLIPVPVSTWQSHSTSYQQTGAAILARVGRMAECWKGKTEKNDFGEIVERVG